MDEISSQLKKGRIESQNQSNNKNGQLETLGNLMPVANNLLFIHHSSSTLLSIAQSSFTRFANWRTFFMSPQNTFRKSLFFHFIARDSALNAPMSSSMT
jgi:hypothetical protein